MTYDASELSTASGEPYFLYLFDNGTIAPTRLTSEPEALTRMSEKWHPSPISHDDVERGGNIEKQALIVNFPLSDAYARTLLGPATFVTTVTVWRGHRNDPTDELKVYWRGRVVGAKDKARTIDVEVESIFTSMRRPGLRARFQRNCRYALYGDGCNTDGNTRASNETAGTVTAVAGLVLTVPEAATAAANDYRGGIVNWGGLFGFVTVHAADQLTLTNDIQGLAEAVADIGAQAVLLAPGCDLSTARCEDRFANDINHGGFAWLPTDNPFETRIV
jgi:hypothetical protein